MKFNTKTALSVLRFSASVLLPTLLFAGVVQALGTLTPPSGSPAASSYTLNDIYTRLTTNATATAGAHDLSTTTSPAATFYSLSDIYSAIPTVDPMTVATGTSYLGISGALLGNMFNGSCDNSSGDFYAACSYVGASFPGGSQAHGGVDDYNGAGLGGARPSDSYATTWTACNSGNSYCGTGDSGADAKDDATGLVWSYPCSGSDCSSWDTAGASTNTTGCLYDGTCAYSTTDTKYTWNSGGGNNNSHTASVLCSEHSGWSLPHQKQLLQAYIDGSYGNLEPQGVYRYYWSATGVSFGTNGHVAYVWLINLSDGYSFDNTESTAHSIRCVR